MEFAPDHGAYVVDESLLDGMFQIHPSADCDVHCTSDLEGGSRTCLVPPHVAACEEFGKPASFECDGEGMAAQGGGTTMSLLHEPIITGMKYAYFRFFVAPLTPTLRSYPYLNLVLPSPADDTIEVKSFVKQLLSMTFLIAAMQSQDQNAFWQGLSSVFARELKLWPSIREYIFSGPSLRKDSGQQAAALRVQLLFLLSLPLPLPDLAALQLQNGTFRLQDTSLNMCSRISWFECVCCDYKALLCLCPGLWCLLPNPFIFPGTDLMWEAALTKARGTLSKISSFLSNHIPILNAEALARVDKRLRAYIDHLRKHQVNILRDPESVFEVLNPCDSSIRKRTWENNLFQARRRWSSLAGAGAEKLDDDLDGGSEIARVQEETTTSPAATLRNTYVFRRPFQTQQECARAWSQLRDFHKALQPLSTTLQRFPSTFWILPVPLDVDEDHTSWQIRLECCSLFLWLIRDSKPFPFEALLITFYWPEIQKDPALLDVVSTRNMSLTLRDRIKKLISAWLLLHILSLPAIKLSSFKGRNPAPMPENLLYRYTRLRRTLKEIRPFKKKHEGRRYIGDVCGGASWPDVTVVSAMSGETLLSFHVPFELEDDFSFLDLVREHAATAFSAPYFCFDVLQCGSLVDDVQTWEDLGRPSLVQLVIKPKALTWTEELFGAIEAGNVQEVKKWLAMGQDPDCTMIDSALNLAVRQNHFPVVQTLVKARANVNYMPMGCSGPLQLAVIHDAESCAMSLLFNGADPNLCDHTSAKNAPLHLAAIYGDAVFTDMLLSYGADPLLQNAFGSSSVTLATPGTVVSLCLAKCCNGVDAVTLLHRHAMLLHSFGCSTSLWVVSKALHHAKPYGDLAGGSSPAPLFTGAEVKSLKPGNDASSGGGTLASMDSMRWVRLCQNRAKALGKKRKACDHLKDIDHDRLVAKGLTASEIERMSARKQEGLMRRCWHQVWEESMPTCLHQSFKGSSSSLAQGVRLPLPVEGWVPVDLGCMPLQFLETGNLGSIPAFDFLKQRNSHERDGRLKFDEPSHTYYVDGIPLDLSVTGFLTAFQEPFDADNVISKMEQQQTWPRQEYLTFKHLRKVEEFARGSPFLWPLLSLLQGHPIDKKSVAELLQQAPRDEAWNGARYLLTMTHAEIKAYWKRNGEVASRLGTWAHLQCECVLNAGQVPSLSPEMLCLSRFLQTSERLMAHRTEWSIWAADERLAGTIDFCATDPTGCLVLIDWKRSKNLKSKYFTSFKNMKGDLSHIPDAVGWKYRLQLNLYKYIVEKYYGFSVSRMLVVDIHPDAQQVPFVDEVPNMQADVKSILDVRAQQLLMSDLQGGATLSLSQASMDETEEVAAMDAALQWEAENQNKNVPAVKLEPKPTAGPAPAIRREEAMETQDPPASQECKREMNEEPAEEIADGETFEKIKRRRLLRGAFTSASDFQDMFQGYQDIAKRELANLPSDCDLSEHSTLQRSKLLREVVRNQKPTWSDDMVRLGAVIIAVCNMRLSDRMFVGDSAFLLWMIEGHSTIRVHSGFCYIYNDDGAFLPYSGTPPEALLSRVSLFCTIVEGSLQRLPTSVSLALVSFYGCLV